MSENVHDITGEPGLPDPSLDMPSPPVRNTVARPGRPAPPQVPPRAQNGTHPISPSAPRHGPVSPPGAATLGVTLEESDEDDILVSELLTKLVDNGGSDLHLSAAAPPLMRVNGTMGPLPGYPRFTASQIDDGVKSILDADQISRFQAEQELDFAYTAPDGKRFRGNLMVERGNIAAVFRAIPINIVPLDALGMPQVLYTFAGLPRGLVLVTGPTGSGKSTTLAAMIDHINRTRAENIITIEDPIEFLHPHRSCVVRQREVGADTHSYAKALKHILRQDPDIILIGELRDRETISIALTAAETGHLVFATLHTQSAQDTISRIIDVFPGDQQSQVRSQLAATLKGVVCQTLIKTPDGKSRVPAAEIMVVNAAIGTQIRQEQIHQIPQSIQSGGRLGMQTLNQHLSELVSTGKIARAQADEKTNDLQDLANLIDGRNKREGEGGGLSGASL